MERLSLSVAFAVLVSATAVAGMNEFTPSGVGSAFADKTITLPMHVEPSAMTLDSHTVIAPLFGSNPPFAGGPPIAIDPRFPFAGADFNRSAPSIAYAGASAPVSDSLAPGFFDPGREGSPNTAPVVPAPTAFVLGALGACAAYFLRRS